MSAIGTLLGIVLTVFILLMIARFVLDWMQMLGNSPDWADRARDVTHRATEPVIGPVRKVLKPIRIGSASLDLAFTAVFLAALILQQIAFSL